MKGQFLIDTGADTSCVGAGFVVLSETGRTASLSGYNDRSNATEIVPIVSAVTAYDGHPTILLVMNEVINLGPNQKTSLLNLNQVRDAGHRTDDIPHFFPGASIFGIDTNNGIHIPFRLEGKSCVLDVRTPTDFELNNSKRIELTSKSRWTPHKSDWEKIENNFKGL